jgi:hypothetical protein
LTGSSPDTYRWTLDEYVLRCTLDASIRELLVEGTLDALFWGDVLDRARIDSVDVFDVGEVAIDGKQIADAGFTHGPKGCLLTLCLALVREPEEIRGLVRCVVDHDFDGVPEGLAEFLVVTDGYSVENYAIGVASIGRFIARHFGALDASGVAGGTRSSRRDVPQEILDRLLPPSIAITAVRRVLRSRHPGVGVIERWPSRFKVRRDGHFDFDVRRLLQDCVNTGERAFADDDVDELHKEMKVIGDSPRERVRGHDFTLLFLVLLRSRWGKAAVSDNVGAAEHEAFERWVVLDVAASDVENEVAPTTIRDWFG